MEEYKALREAAAIGEVSPRAQIAVAGSDRAAYLQGLLTNDIQALTAGTGCYAAWLTPQGRMITDLHVLESGDMILLDVPAELSEAIIQRLDQFLFSEDVQLAPLSGQLRAIPIHGPGAAAVLEKTVPGASSLEAWKEYQNARFDLDGVPVVLARVTELDVPGYRAYVAASSADSFVRALTANGAVSVSQDVIDVVRVEAGYPVFGIDMTDDTIPLEAGIEDRAISLTKGCYVGQEIIIRVLHRGGGRVARKLVSLRIDGETPAAGSRLLAGDRDIGAVTSAAWSPTFGTIALAYVHRDFTAPGTSLTVAGRGGRQAATVTPRRMTSVA